MECESYALALASDADAPEFARGVELGRLWERLRADPGPVEEMMHLTNAEMALRVGEALDRRVVAEDRGDTWMTVRFSAVDRWGPFDDAPQRSASL